MDELGLPPRLFDSGFEPAGRKRVNSYFKLRWIDIIKKALEPSDLAVLEASQFGRLLQMGGHTFPVMFMHYLLSRQLVTEKDFKLWWLLVGKPIRYAIQDFALVTGLNCAALGVSDGDASSRGVGRSKVGSRGKSSQSIWEELFRGVEKPTVEWIMARLVKGQEYKDPLTRFRLALLVLVDGILCPTCGMMNIRPDVVSRLSNIDEFINYPWGRESFLLTVRSAKGRKPIHYVQETMAIQGFTHGMVLVAITACPSIFVKASGGDPLVDSALSSSEIVRHIIGRKLAVNPVTAKAVDELGQAYVRSIVCTDPAAELLSQSLGDTADSAVLNLVSLILEDYPFEHSIWAGGVRADDVKQKRPAVSSSESSGEDDASGMEKDTHSTGGVDSAGPSAGRPPTSSRSHQPPGQHPASSSVDVPALLRRAADAYEERMTPLFEGYILSLKAHFHTEIGVLRTDLQAATSAMRDLGNCVTSEMENLRNYVKGWGTSYEGSPIGGSRPSTHQTVFGDEDGDDPPASVPSPLAKVGRTPLAEDTPYQPQDIPSADIPKCPVSVPAPAPATVTPSGLHVPTSQEQPPTDIPMASTANDVPSNISEMDGMSSVPPVGDTSNGQAGEGERETPLLAPPKVSHNVPLSGEDDHETSPQESNLDPRVDTVVEEILSAAGMNKDGLHSTVDPEPSAGVPLQPSKTVRFADNIASSASTVPLNVGVGPTAPQTAPAVRDTPPPDVAGSLQSDPVEGNKAQGDVEDLESDDDVPLRRHSRKGPRTRGGSTTAASVGGIWFSKRRHTSPHRYSPSEQLGRKESTRKTTKSAALNAPPKKRSKLGGVSTSVPIPPKIPLPIFIGGYNAFSPPAPANRVAFLKRLEIANSTDVASGADVFISSLGDLFHCTGVCSVEAMELVVNVIRVRRDRLPSPRFDFVPPSFFVELLRNYPGFHAVSDKHSFAFSHPLKSIFLQRPKWFTDVDFIYGPVLIKKSQWVGVVLDLKMWAIYIVDSNPASPSQLDVHSFVTPISKMLPHLISSFCITPRPLEMNFKPLPISRVEVPILLEHPGFSGVASLILLELSAADQPLNSISLSEEEVRVAAKNYAIVAMASIQSGL